MQSKEKFYLFFLLVIGMIFGAYIRFASIPFWNHYKHLFFYKGEPLYSEFDSFLFARYARDIKEGIFHPGEVDSFRFFPDNTTSAKVKDMKFYREYSREGTLISFIWGMLSKVTGIPIAKLTWYLVPIFAVLLAIPVFLFFKELGYPYAGILGALVGITCGMYYFRTDLMRLDTDMFTLTFPFLIGYFFLKFFKESNESKKYLWIALSSVSVILYQMWYAHANLCFVLLGAFLVRFFWEKRLNLKKNDIVFLSILIVPQLWYIYKGPLLLFYQLRNIVFNIKHTTSAQQLFKDFPNIYMSISELQHLSPKAVFGYIIYHYWIVGLIGFVGFAIFCIRHLKDAILILPLFLVGILSFISGSRFVMYLGPFVGAGLGAILHFIFNWFLPKLGLFEDERKRKIVLHVLGTALFVFLILIQYPLKKVYATPKIFSPLVKDMKYLSTHTPKNSVIWTWWDYGYAFQLYARRATFHDGGSQGSPKTYFIARSFATNSPEEAWNITSFITNYGLTGIAKNLLKGLTAESLVKKVEHGDFDKPLKAPVYWVFTSDLVPKFPWIYYFGSYDFHTHKGKHIQILQVLGCNQITSKILACGVVSSPRGIDVLMLDLSSGMAYLNKIVPGSLTAKILGFNGTSGKIYAVFNRSPETLKVTRFKENKGGIVVAFITDKMNRHFIYMFPYDVGTSVFVKMYLLRDYDQRYFKLVLDDFPVAVVYRVKTRKGR